MKWPEVEIGSLCRVARGGSPRPINQFMTEDDDGVNWIKISDATASGKVIRSTKERIKPEGLAKSRAVFAGDFLLSNSMSFGRPYLLEIDGAIHDGWLVLQDMSPCLDKAYLYEALQAPSVQSQFHKRASGTTVKNLNAEIVRTVKIPLPPLEEQKRIAVILDEADRVRKKTQALIDKYDELAQSLFLDMFGDPVTNPKGWEVMKFAEIGSLDRGKSKHRPRNAPELLGGEHPLIQTGDLSNCGVYLRSYESTYSDFGLSQSKKWSRGTLCITIAANIAKTGILGFEACFPDSIVGFNANDKAVNEYVLFWLSFLQETLERNAPESAQKNINLKILRNLELPVPPRHEQVRFRELLTETEQSRMELNRSISSHDLLFNALLQKAFKGELT